MCENASAESLLAWYDRHARDLPWRIGPKARKGGQMPDPYRVWLSEIMLQQTTVAAVKSYFEAFTERWPNVAALAGAEDGAVMAAWAGLGYYARARNLLKCARAVTQDFDGDFPKTRAGLQALPGIGPYTSAAIAAIAYDHPETVVDGNVERVMSRLFLVETPLPNAKPELSAHAARLTPERRAGDYAQAVMDLGATICTPRKPACALCPWAGACLARAAGRAAEFPKKSPKQPKPIRFGIAYLATRADGAWLLEERPPQGLLGGMLGWPGSDWGETRPQDQPPFPADWQSISGEVRHTFTHFHLRLTLRTTCLPAGTKAPVGKFIPASAFRAGDLPTVMRKAFDLATKPATTPKSAP